MGYFINLGNVICRTDDAEAAKWIAKRLNRAAEAEKKLARSKPFGYVVMENPAEKRAELEGQEAVAYIERITARLALPDDDHRTKFPMAYEPLYATPQPTPDTQALVNAAVAAALEKAEATLAKIKAKYNL